MKKRINVTQTFLPPFEEYARLIKKLWDTKHLTNRGEYVIELENKIQNCLNSKAKPLLTCNGTMALQLAIKALELKGEIITTPFSYVATTSSIVWEGCNPIFVDINPEYLTIDETKIEAAITKKTSAILATHVYGNPCHVEAIDQIAKKHNLKVIYDAAHCFGVKFKAKSIFDYGDISICSFHATKIFHTGEGGAVFCNDTHLAKKIFNHHNFGHAGTDKFHGLGINGKMSEINAAMGLSTLPYFDEIFNERKLICKTYNENLNYSKIRRLSIRENCEWNYSYFPIIFQNGETLKITIDNLNANNIFPRRYFYPSLNNLPYLNPIEMPNSDDISKMVLCLPLSYNVSYKDLELICGIINKNN